MNWLRSAGVKLKTSICNAAVCLGLPQGGWAVQARASTSISNARISAWRCGPLAGLSQCVLKSATNWLSLKYPPASTSLSMARQTLLATSASWLASPASVAASAAPASNEWAASGPFVISTVWALMRLVLAYRAIAPWFGRMTASCWSMTSKMALVPRSVSGSFNMPSTCSAALQQRATSWVISSAAFSGRFSALARSNAAR